MNLAIRDIRHNAGRFDFTSVGIGQYAFPKFPRLVLIVPADLVSLAIIVVVISTVASLLGIWKAMNVEPNTVLSA